MGHKTPIAVNGTRIATRRNSGSSLARSRRSRRALIAGLLVALIILWWRAARHGEVASDQVPHPQDAPPTDLSPLDERSRQLPLVRTTNKEDAISDEQQQPGPKSHFLTLQNPQYNLRVLHTILQHSNTSWQTTKNEARGYFVQSLIWMQMINGLRPVSPGKYMSANCTFPGGYPPRAARIHPFDLHPGDRSTGHGFVFYVDCQLPYELQESPFDLTQVEMSYAMSLGNLMTPTLPGLQQNVTFTVGSHHVPLDISPPMQEKVEFAVCLSPLTWTYEDLPMWNLLEWRLHYAKLGVERVNWYARDSSFEPFVDLYKELKGGKDTYSLVPSLLEHAKHAMQPWEIYGDQDAWYMDCILRNAFSSEFILVLDTDEFITPDFRLDKPMDQFKDFMRSMSPDKGTIEFDRMPMARPYERGEPDFWEEMLQTQFDCYHRNDMQTTKTMYRAHSVIGMHQHLQRKMYPMPPGIASAVSPKPESNQRYGWHLQHSFKEDVWPKLLHYRWWGILSYDVCSDPSPVHGMPKYIEYLKSLRAEVKELAEYIEEAYVKILQGNAKSGK